MAIQATTGELIRTHSAMYPYKTLTACKSLLTAGGNPINIE
jgi:hypothetical protein